MDSCTCNKPDLRVFESIAICVGCGVSAEPDNTTLSPSTTFQSSDFDIESPSSHNSTDLVRADDEDYLGSDGPESVPTEYVHAPLDLRHECCIRLIRLYPGRDDEDLVCQIIHADLNKSPVYEAISYTWADESGGRAPSKTLYCPRRTLRITSNCEKALRRVRQSGLTRAIWIDCICIDQQNIKERNHQVSLMKQIYAGASQVLVYAGESSPYVDLLLDQVGNTQQEPNCTINSKDLDLAMESLLYRTWFHRVWVLQEVIVAKLVVFIVGERSIDFSLLSLRRFSELGLKPMMKDGLMPGIYRWVTLQPSGSDLLCAFHIGRNCRASDARDKVFGLLGLLDDDIDESLRPDYELTVAEVYIQTAAYAISSQSTLAVLSYASYDAGSTDYTPIDTTDYTRIGLPQEWEHWRRVLGVAKRRQNHNLPSWVPNWSVSTYSEPLKPYYTSEHRLNYQGQWQCNATTMYHAAGRFPRAQLAATSLRTISVLAVFAIKLDKVSGPIRYTHNRKIRQEYTGVARLLNMHDFPRPSDIGEHREPAYTWTPHKSGWKYHPRDGIPAHPNPEHPCLRNISFWSRIIDLEDCRYPQRPYPPMFATKTTCRCKPTHEDLSAEDNQVPNSSWYTQVDGSLCTCYHLSQEPGTYESDDNSGFFWSEMTDFDDKALEDFESEVASHGAGRVMFETTLTFGIGPPSMGYRDTIWRLQGAAVPFVLRHIDEDRYVVIGECYLRGANMMEGCWASELEDHGRCYTHGAQRKPDCGIPQMIKLV